MDEEEKEAFIRSFAPMRGKEGLPDGPKPTSQPKARKPQGLLAGINESVECPICGCEEIMEIEQDVEHEGLRGGTGMSVYLGCPACPWASEMLTIATGGRNVD
jgi:hypothetical protein